MLNDYLSQKKTKSFRKIHKKTIKQKSKLKNFLRKGLRLPFLWPRSASYQLTSVLNISTHPKYLLQVILKKINHNKNWFLISFQDYKFISFFCRSTINYILMFNNKWDNFLLTLLFCFLLFCFCSIIYFYWVALDFDITRRRLRTISFGIGW